MRIAALLLLVGCEHAEPPAHPPAKPAVATVPATFDAPIREAALAYKQWGRVDDRPRPAPAPCAAAMPVEDPPPVQPRLSAAKDAPHGEKLYFLWANDRDAYLNQKVEVGFTIVKESFQQLGKDGVLKQGDPTGLFVMTKVGGNNTDDGWIYGTVSPSGEVTGSGRIQVCMGCHVDKPDRLFGLKK